MEEMHYKQNLGVSQIKQIARNVPSRLDKEAKLCNDRKRQIERGIGYWNARYYNTIARFASFS